MSDPTGASPRPGLPSPATARRTARPAAVPVSTQVDAALLVEHNVHGIATHSMICDADGRPTDYVFLAVNPGFEEMTGLKGADILGRRVTEVLPGIEEGPFIAAYGKVAQTGEPLRFVQHSPEIGRTYDISAFSSRPGRFTTIFVDITELTEAKQQLRRHGEELEAQVAARTADLDRAIEELQREAREHEQTEARLRSAVGDLERSNRALERFAYAVSHDLQEPLRMVSGFVTLLRKRYGPSLPEPAREFIDLAADGAQRMGSFIEGLLAYSRVTRGEESHHGPVDLGAIVDDLCAVSLRRSIAEASAVISHAGLPSVDVSRVRAEQLLLNLLGNALKFRGDQPPRIQVVGRRLEGSWEVRVQDNGIGMDPSQAAQAFEVFRRLHAADGYSGHGIGLALCQRIVQGWGGRIEVETSTGSGCTFVVTIPDGR